MNKPFVNTLAAVKKMVISLAYDFASGKVVLIVKNRPDWMAGLLNGVGGKVEPGETPLAASVREFFQETGVQTAEEDWQLFHYEKRSDGPELFFYCARLDGVSGLVQSKTDERVVCLDVQHWSLIAAPMLYNLGFLVPMGLCFLQNPEHRYEVAVH